MDQHLDQLKEDALDAGQQALKVVKEAEVRMKQMTNVSVDALGRTSCCSA